MTTATKTTTTKRNPQEGVSATSITELGGKEAFSASEVNVESLVVSQANHRLSGGIVHPLAAFYDWISGPPTISRQRNRARMAYAQHSRTPSGIIV